MLYAIYQLFKLIRARKILSFIAEKLRDLFTAIGRTAAWEFLAVVIRAALVLIGIAVGVSVCLIFYYPALVDLDFSGALEFVREG